MTFLRVCHYFAILTVCLPIAACSVFDTRDPEPPGRGDGSAFIQPDQPRDVIENLINSIANLNRVNYLNCISDEFYEYTPTNQAYNSAPELWSSWTKGEEEIYFRNLSATAENFQGHQLQFHDEETQQIDNTFTYNARYTLTVNHNHSSGITEARGNIRLTLRAGEDGLWAIESWSDSPVNDGVSWSDIRATFVR